MSLFSYLHGIASILIALLIFSFRKDDGMGKKRMASLAAYVLFCAALVLAFGELTDASQSDGFLSIVKGADFIFDVFLVSALWRVKGNVMVFFPKKNEEGVCNSPKTLA